ncbi:MAG: VOC family protein [Myxococcota bacterium]
MAQGFQCVAARPVLGSASIDRTHALWCGVLGFEVAVAREGFLLLQSGTAEVAFRLDPSPAPGRVTLEVDDVGAAHERCTAAGVDIASALHAHDSGRRDFIVRDPDGHFVEIAQPPRRGGRIAWVDLTVEDASTSRDFWAAVGGFDGVEAVSMGEYHDFSLMSDGRARAGVCHRIGPNATLPSVWLVYFSVDDLEVALTEAESRGGTVLERRGRMAVVRGPQGAVAAVYQA